MTTPTPEPQDAILGTVEQPLRHANSIWADERCGEESGEHHLKYKGAVLAAEGWGAEAELDIDGFYVKPVEVSE